MKTRSQFLKSMEAATGRDSHVADEELDEDWREYLHLEGHKFID